jgi:hypothetical protein
MKKRKTLQSMAALILSVVMLMGMLPAVAGAQTSDITGHWAEDILLKWAAEGLLYGDGSGNYSPDRPITRAELAALINRWKGYTAESDKIGQFKDVSPGKWYYKDISIALSSGYLSGTSATTISPEALATREHAMSVVARISGIDPASDTAVLTKAADGNEVSDWAKGLVSAVINEGLIGGSFGKIHPLAGITRAEAIVLLDRVKADARIYTFAGTYDSASPNKTVGSVSITTPDIFLKNLTILGDLTIGEGVGEGSVHLENVKILGNAFIRGGGKNSVYLHNVSVNGSLSVNRLGGQVRIVATGTTSATVAVLESGAILVTRNLVGGSIDRVTIPASLAAGQSVVLDGSFKVVENNAASISLSTVGRVGSLVLNQPTTVTGGASIGSVTTAAGAGSVVNGNVISGGQTGVSATPPAASDSGPRPEPEPMPKPEPVDKDETVDMEAEPEFINLNLDTDPPLEAVATNYLLYGYNVLQNGYMDTNKIAKDAPIFDKTKVIEDKTGSDPGHYTITPTTKSTSSYLYSKKVSSLYDSFDVSSTAEYKGLFFSGGFKSDFKTSTAISNEEVIIKNIQHHQTKEQAYTASLSTLKELLSADFLNDVKKYAGGNKDTNPDFAPEVILNKYGTHSIKQYFLGGRTELNFIFNNHSNASTSEISASVEATYKRFSGSVDAETKKKSNMVYNNSRTYFTSVGGNNINGSTAEVIASQYPEWLKSIEGKEAFCGIAGIDSSLRPIWDLVDEPAATNLKNAFIEAAKTAETDLAVLDGVPYYVTDILVFSHKDAEYAKTQLPDGYKWVTLNPGTFVTEPLEANKGAGGNYIYIAYKLSPDKDRAIADLLVIGGDTGDVKAHDGYHKIPIDLNDGAGGKWLYLEYRRANKDDTLFLKEIRGVYNASYEPPSGWKTMGGYTGNLNIGCKSDAEFVRLVYRRGA